MTALESMTPYSPTPRPARESHSLRGDLIGGMTGALIVIPTLLSCGSVIFSGISGSLVAMGIASAFVSATICALVAGAFGGHTLHVINCPKTSHAAILAGLCTVVLAQPGFVSTFPGPTAVPALLMVCFLAIFVSGITQFCLGAARLGTVVKFVPQPVLAGFINGFALQIIVGQIPGLFGIKKLAQFAVHGTTLLSPWPLSLGILTLVTSQLSRRFLKMIPAPLVGMTIGALAWQAGAHFVPEAALGPLIGALPEQWIPQFRLFEIVHFALSPGFLSLAFPILATGLTLAMISSIQSLMSIATADRLADTRHNSNQELMVQGVGNLLAAICGGAPSGGSPNVTQAVFAAGARTQKANFAHAAAMIMLAIALGKVIALIPISVMAAVVITTTLALFDKWTRQLFQGLRTTQGKNRIDIAINLTVILTVTVLVIAVGALAALGTGMSLAFVIFLYRAGDQSVRRVLRAGALRSRTSRSPKAYEALESARARIALVEMEGAMFFGSIDSVITKAEAELEVADWLILDFARVSLIDSSGAMLLKRLDDAIKKQRKRLLFSGLAKDSPHVVYMNSVGFDAPTKENRIFASADEAMHLAEEELLGHLGITGPIREVALGEFEVLKGLTEQEIEHFSNCLTQREYPADSTLIRTGDTDRSIYLLTRGNASVRLGGDGPTRNLPIFRYEAGTLFGEVALLSGQPRSADVIAETSVIVHELTPENFEQLTTEEPKIAVQLMRNLAAIMATRLRNQTEVIRQLGA